MAKNYELLRKRLSPEQRAQSAAEVREMEAEMLLQELRRQEGVTQEELARKLGVRQPSVSKIESQDDMQISTLSRMIEALGGRLELIAHMPRGDIRIKQFRA